MARHDSERLSRCVKRRLQHMARKTRDAGPDHSACRRGQGHGADRRRGGLPPLGHAQARLPVCRRGRGGVAGRTACQCDPQSSLSARPRPDPGPESPRSPTRPGDRARMSKGLASAFTTSLACCRTARRSTHSSPNASPASRGLRSTSAWRTTRTIEARSTCSSRVRCRPANSEVQTSLAMHTLSGEPTYSPNGAILEKPACWYSVIASG